MVGQVCVTVTLDAHGGEREREHDERWCELQWRLEAVMMQGRYDTLNPNICDHECGQSFEACQATRAATSV